MAARSSSCYGRPRSRHVTVKPGGATPRRRFASATTWPSAELLSRGDDRRRRVPLHPWFPAVPAPSPRAANPTTQVVTRVLSASAPPGRCARDGVPSDDASAVGLLEASRSGDRSHRDRPRRGSRSLRRRRGPAADPVCRSRARTRRPLSAKPARWARRAYPVRIGASCGRARPPYRRQRGVARFATDAPDHARRSGTDPNERRVRACRGGLTPGGTRPRRGRWRPSLRASRASTGSHQRTPLQTTTQPGRARVRDTAPPRRASFKSLASPRPELRPVFPRSGGRAGEA